MSRRQVAGTDGTNELTEFEDDGNEADRMDAPSGVGGGPWRD